MSTLKININIAGRQYPLTIRAEEEEIIRKTGKEINALIKEFEEKYAVTDKQDALSMVALQMATKLNLSKKTELELDSQVNEKLNELSLLIEEELNKN